MSSYGPALPPGPSGSTDQGKEEPGGKLGPTLPPGLSQDSSDSEADSSDSTSSNEQQSDSSKSQSKDYSVDSQRVTRGGRAVRFIGPVVPGGTQLPELPEENAPQESDHEDDEDYAIGPQLHMASGKDTASGSVAAEFEKRAKRMRDKLLNQSDMSEVTERDSWMTELPEQKVLSQTFGAMPIARGLTSGRDLATSEERSEWTDTPADKARKEEEGKQRKGVKRKAEPVVMSERDRAMSKHVNEYNKAQRTESLLEMHEKKLHKKDKKEHKKKSKSKKDKKKKKKKDTEKEKKKDKKDKKEERRPFDRDQDLGVNRFDNAMRKKLVKQSAELNTKFSSSSVQKFL